MSMKTIFLPVAIMLFAVAGCAGVNPNDLPLQKQVKPDVADTGKKADQDAGERVNRKEMPGNSYYHYIVSQMQIRQGDMQAAAASLEEAVSLDPGSTALKKELAIVYIQTDEKKKALHLAEQILRRTPDDIESLIIAGSIRQTMGDTEAAWKAYEKVIDLAPERKNIYLVLGRLYMEEEKYDRAVDVFSRLVEQFPEEYTGFFYLGKVYTEKGEKEKAIEAYRRTLELQPELVEPRTELVKLYSSENNEEKVLSLYEEIIQRDPEDVGAMIELGLMYHQSGRDQDADTIFTELGERSDTDENVVNTIVQNLVVQKRYEDALTAIGQMLETVPENQDLHYLAGVSAYLLERFDDSMVHLKSVGPDSRFYPDAMIQQAGVYSHREEPENAVAVLEKALGNLGEGKRDEKLKLLKYLSAVHEEREDFDRAADTLKKGLSLDDSNTDLRFRLGVVYENAGETGKAMEQMKQILEIDPEHADALNYIGYTWADSGVQLDRAEEYIKKALQQKPDNGYILDSLGWVYFKKGRLEEAVEQLERAASIVPDDPIILEHLGDAYVEQNKSEKALELYRRALERKESNTDGLQSKIEKLIEE